MRSQTTACRYGVTTRPESSPDQLLSTARAMAAAALPPPMTTVLPGGSGGNLPEIRPPAWTASTAWSKRAFKRCFSSGIQAAGLLFRASTKGRSLSIMKVELGGLDRLRGRLGDAGYREWLAHLVDQLESQLRASDHAATRGAHVVALTLPYDLLIRVNLASGFRTFMDSIGTGTVTTPSARCGVRMVKNLSLPLTFRQVSSISSSRGRIRSSMLRPMAVPSRFAEDMAMWG